MWLKGDESGIRADLSCCDLTGLVCPYRANLEGANIEDVIGTPYLYTTLDLTEKTHQQQLKINQLEQEL